MKKYFACAVLPLMIVACGDDSSSNAKTGDSGKPSERAEIAHAGECGAFTPWDGEGEAFVVGSKGSGFQVLLPKVRYDVELCSECLYERSGDTLHIWNSDSTREALNWFCTTDFTFDISDADADIKYFKYENAVFKVVDGPVPERISSGMAVSSSSENPSSSEPAESSSSQGGSSAGLPDLSSSSIAPGSSSSAQPAGRVTQMATHVGGKCLDKEGPDDPMVDGGADMALPPVATMVLEDGSSFATVVVERVKIPCSEIGGFAGMLKQVPLDSIEVTAAGDTLYVKPLMHEDDVSDGCACQAQVYFTMRAEGAFTQTSLLVMDDNLNLGNRMRIAKETVESEDMKQLKMTGYYKGQCLNGFSENNPKVMAAPAAKDLPTATLLYNPDGLSIVELNNVEDYCDIEAKVSQKVKDDTLFVDYYDMGAVSKCVCTFDKIKFAVDEENTHVAFFSFKSVLYRLQGMEVVD